MSLRYRLVLPTGTLGSFIGYFKRKISPSRSEQLSSWDGKGAMCEARGREFKSQPKTQPKRIFYVNFEGLGTGCFTRYQRLTLGVPVQKTGTKGILQPVPKSVFLVVSVYIVWQGDGSRYSRVACPLAVTHTVYRDRSTRVVYSVHVCMMNLYSTMVRSVCSTPGFKTLPTHGPKQQPIVLVPRIDLKLVIGTIINLTSYVGQHVYSFVFFKKTSIYR